MRFPRFSNSPLRRLAVTCLAFLAVLLSCGKDVTAPGARGAKGGFLGNLAVAPQFPEILTQTIGASGTVSFNRVRIVLRRVDLSIALDKTVDFPASATTVPLTLDVPLLPSTTASGESLTLTLEYLNSDNAIVFTGGPTTIVVTPTVPGSTAQPAVDVPVKYSGPGANASKVVIAPKSLAAPSGSTFSFTAQALDASNAVLAGTPIVFTSLDPTLATVSATGSGTAIGARGTARIVAQLLTGPTDIATLTIQPVATAIALVSGSGQTNSAGTTLALPLVVKVTASDGLGVAGASVTFSATGGGTVTSAATTDASGFAQATWKLGATVGAQSVTANGGTAGQVVFTATATAATPTKLVVTSAPTSGTATIPLVNFVVTAQDANSNIATAFTGQVTVSLGGGTAGATLSGTTTVNAVSGVATFSALGIGKAGTAYTLTASASGLTSATSAPFDIIAGTANKLVFTGQPTDAVAGASVGTLTVAVQDAAGNPITTFTGPVTLGLALNPGASAIGGTTTVTAVAGVATFTGISLNRPGSGYAFVASAVGLASGNSGTFSISIGAASTITLVSGGAQSATVSAALTLPIVVRVSDAAGNAVAGKALTFAVTTGGGTVTPPSVTTIAGGLATVNWTLGATPGAQSITVSGAGLTSLVVAATATGSATATQMAITAGQGQLGTQFTPLPISLAVTIKDASNNPVAGYTVNWAVAAGGGSLSAATSVSDVAGIATVGLTPVNAGLQVVQATGAGLTGSPAVFNATAGALGYNKTWLGTTSTAWAVATNWAPSGVPSSGDSAYVPAGGNQPTISSSTTVTHLGMGNGAVLTVNGSTTLSLLGKLNAASIVGAGIVDLNGTGGLSAGSPGTIANNVIISGTYSTNTFGGPTVGGNLTVTGSFTLGGTMNVTGNVATSGSGTLTQVVAGSQLIVTGALTFAGGSETGRLTNGSLSTSGSFTQSGSPTSFVATGLHSVSFNTTGSATLSQANPTTATFAGLTFNGPGTVTINNDIITSANFYRYGGVVNGAGRKVTIGGQYNNNANHLAVTFDSVIFVGSSSPVAVFTSVIVGPVKFRSGTPTLGIVQVNGNVVIDSTAIVSFPGGRLRVTGNLTTAGNGIVKMTGSGDQLDVYGNATFGGGSTTGLLTDGIVNIQGSFAQTTTPTAYAPSGLHLTNMITTPVASTISFANPNNSFFQNAKFQSLVVDSMLTNVWVKGNLQVLGPAQTIGAVGTGMTIGGTLTDVSSKLRPGALSFAGSTTPVSATTPSISLSQANAVTFNNNPSIIAANLTINATTFSLGNLQLGGHTVIVNGDFATQSSGQLSMTAVLDTLIVNGNATFASTGAGGPMLNGVLNVLGNFTQSGAVNSFQASLPHATYLLPSVAGRTVIFASPGFGNSHFAELYVSDTAVTTLNSDVYVDGKLETGIVTAHTLASSNLLLTSRGADVRDLKFDNTRWLIVEGEQISTAQNVQFVNMSTTLTQLEIQQTNLKVPVNLNLFNFSTVPTSGLYLKVTDTNGATNGNLAITMSSPTPSYSGPYTAVFGGATIAGWPPFAPATAIASGAWNTTSTWNTGIVPNASTNVTIPNSFSVSLTQNEAAANLTVNGTLSLGSMNFLTAGGNVSIGAGGIVGCTGDQLIVSGSAASLTAATGATVCGVRITGNATLQSMSGGSLGNVNILNGSLTVNGQYMTATTLTTSGTGTGGALVMTNSADSVIVTGTTRLGGVRNTTGLMTAGSLVALGDIVTDTGFIASGTHKVWVASNSAMQHIQMNPFNSLNGFKDLIFDGNGSKLLDAGQGNYGLNVNGRLLARTGSATIVNGSTAFGSPTIWVHGGAVYDSSSTSDRYQFTSMYVSGVTALPKAISVSQLDFENAPYTMTDSLRAHGLVLVNGPSAVLTMNGHTLRVVAGNGFSTQTGGKLVQTNSVDTLDVSGSISFDGGSENGQLTAGYLIARGNFTQAATSSTSSFRPTGGHRTIVAGSGTYTFATPGPTNSTSQFANLEVYPGLVTALASNLFVVTLNARSDSGIVTFSGTGQDLEASFPNIPGSNATFFNNVTFTSRASGTPILNNLSFANFPANFTGSMFSYQRSTGGNLFDALSFSGTLGATGRYITNTGSGAVTLTNPNPTAAGALTACGGLCTAYYSGTVTWP